MKKISLFLIMIIAVIGLSSCEHDDDVVFVAQPDAEGVAFTSTFSSNYTLNPSVSENLAERFVWNEVDFGTPTNITYELQGSASQDFSSFDVIGTTSETNLGVTVAQMMSLATDAGLDNDPMTEAPNTGTIYFRVLAYAGNNEGNAMNATSPVASLTVTLPEAAEEGGGEELPKIYVTGNFAAASGYNADWSPADGVPLAASAAGNTDYEGFIYMNVDAPQYKFLANNENWDVNYGDAGDADGSYSETLAAPGVNAGTPDGTGGYFWVKANPDELTYSLTETNWGVIGNATPTGWDSDTDMTYDADAKVWTVTLDLTYQEAPDNGIKFRANDAWDINIGDNDADGTMEFNGQNIGVPEDGNYTITLDLSNPRQYTYTLTKN